MQLAFVRAEKLVRGCGWFSLFLGIGSGWSLGYWSHKVVLVDSNLLHQFLTHILFGHLPTFFVSSFVLLRVGFHLATESDMRSEWTSSEQASKFAISCALVSLLAWAWFFFSAMLGFYLGLLQVSDGYAAPFWSSYWLDFDLTHIFHAMGRMCLLSVVLSGMIFLEVNFLREHRDHLGMLMSRFMTLGMFLILLIEILDVTLL